MKSDYGGYLFGPTYFRSLSRCAPSLDTLAPRSLLPAQYKSSYSNSGLGNYSKATRILCALNRLDLWYFDHLTDKSEATNDVLFCNITFLTACTLSWYNACYPHFLAGRSTILDECGCCEVCKKYDGELCGIDPYHTAGRCVEGMKCEIPMEGQPCYHCGYCSKSSSICLLLNRGPDFCSHL